MLRQLMAPGPAPAAQDQPLDKKPDELVQDLWRWTPKAEAERRQWQQETELRRRRAAPRALLPEANSLWCSPADTSRGGALRAMAWQWLRRQQAERHLRLLWAGWLS